MRILLWLIVALNAVNVSGAEQNAQAEKAFIANIDSVDEDGLVRMHAGQTKLEYGFSNMLLPEKGDEHREKALSMLRNSLVGKMIGVVPSGQTIDNQKRALFYMDARNINLEFVRYGHGWVDLRQTRSKEWLRNETTARVEGRGLFEKDRKREGPTTLAKKDAKKPQKALVDRMSDMSTALKKNENRIFFAFDYNKSYWPYACKESLWSALKESAHIFTSEQNAQKAGFRRGDVCTPREYQKR